MQGCCNDFFYEFELEVEHIKKTNANPITQAKLALEYIEIKLKELFLWLEKFIFNSKEDEIHFFKELKFKITSKYIFFNRILDIESKSPSNSKKLKIKHYEKALNNCFQFSKQDKEFYKYYRSGSIHNDHLYFIRNSEKQTSNLDISLINFDKKLCTSHDVKVANIIANDILEIYLEEKIEEINSSPNSNHQTAKSNLNWTGSKIEMVELIYGLHNLKMFNGGNTDIKEIAGQFSKTFNIVLDDSIYRCFQDIKNRKTIKTKFLHSLSENFNNKIVEEEQN
ncbi:hypothetical protein H4V97_000033 [Flavobacterium sp. CG_23.5]|uniref:RteC domain-containing protein n=1 Tax=Flavobacterium sp. CG_23.5 TaxID=2760708 RepID=UPI001AE909C3|nr:RteC domain-containing protein [Flavobacterium sp. CG_23.5]MBP2281715.1 hypothetical protein [Flavobacterium sp. CG_23.5]